MRRTTKIKTKGDSPEWYVAKRVLKLHDITYEEMGRRINVSVTSVHDMVNHPPSVMHVKLMADAIGCSFFDFFDFSHEPASSPSKPSADFGNTFACPNCHQQFLLTPIANSPFEE